MSKDKLKKQKKKHGPNKENYKRFRIHRLKVCASLDLALMERILNSFWNKALIATTRLFILEDKVILRIPNSLTCPSANKETRALAMTAVYTQDN